MPNPVNSLHVRPKLDSIVKSMGELGPQSLVWDGLLDGRLSRGGSSISCRHSRGVMAKRRSEDDTEEAKAARRAANERYLKQSTRVLVCARVRWRTSSRLRALHSATRRSRLPLHSATSHRRALRRTSKRMAHLLDCGQHLWCSRIQFFIISI